MNRELADNWFKAFQIEDLSILELADDFVHSSPFGDIEGKETYLNLVKENEDAFFGNPIKILDVIDSGDAIAVRYIVGDMPGCDCFYFQDGKITKIYAYYHFGKKPSL